MPTPNPTHFEGRTLHHREARGKTLTSSEKVLAGAFRQDVERRETAERAPVTQKETERIAAKETRNQKLAALLERQAALLTHLQTTLHDAEVERQAIVRERNQIEQTVVSAVEHVPR